MEQLTSFGLDIGPLESSRSRLGVRLIFRVSKLSSLKNESVFLTVPFLDLLVALSSALSKFSSLVRVSSVVVGCSGPPLRLCSAISSTLGLLPSRTWPLDLSGSTVAVLSISSLWSVFCVTVPFCSCVAYSPLPSSSSSSEE